MIIDSIIIAYNQSHSLKIGVFFANIQHCFLIGKSIRKRSGLPWHMSRMRLTYDEICLIYYDRFYSLCYFISLKPKTKD